MHRVETEVRLHHGEEEGKNPLLESSPLTHVGKWEHGTRVGAWKHCTRVGVGEHGTCVGMCECGTCMDVCEHVGHGRMVHVLVM